MNIGVPKEIKAQENRVSMVPGSVAELVKRGHRVFLERGAGEGASYPDELYQAAGAEILDGPGSVFAAADLIVKVKEPQPSEVAMLGPRHLLFTYLHLAANKQLTESLMAGGCPAIAYETIEVTAACRCWTMLIAEKGLAGACEVRKELLGGINTRGGKLTCQPVAEAHGMEFSAIH